MVWLACFSHSMAPLGSADASGQRAHDAPKHVHARRPKKYLGDAVIVGRESSGGGTLGQFIRFWGSTEMCDDFWPHVYARWIVEAQTRTRTPISSHAWRDTTVKLLRNTVASLRWPQACFLWASLLTCVARACKASWWKLRKHLQGLAGHLTAKGPWDVFCWRIETSWVVCM